MTKNERFQISALDRCRFGLRAFDKRFVRDLAAQLRKQIYKPLSNEQRFTLAKIVYRYRRQLDGRLPSDLILQKPPRMEDFGLTDEPQLIDDLFTGESSPPHRTDDYGSKLLS